MLSYTGFTRTAVPAIAFLAFTQLLTVSIGQVLRDSSHSSRNSRGASSHAAGDSTFRLLPRYNPDRDTSGIQFIPRELGKSEVHIQSNIPLTDTAPYQRPPEIMKPIEPEYPRQALCQGLERSVALEILVDMKGRPVQIVVAQSDAAVFDSSAIEAAKKFVYLPAIRDSMPVTAWMRCKVQFRIQVNK